MSSFPCRARSVLYEGDRAFYVALPGPPAKADTKFTLTHEFLENPMMTLLDRDIPSGVG